MYVVAITRWAQPLEQEAVVLAPLLGMAAYDLKLRLAGPLPAVFARAPELARARELLAALRARGHGAVACDLARVDVHGPESVRQVELEARGGPSQGEGRRFLDQMPRVLLIQNGEVPRVTQVLRVDAENAIPDGVKGAAPQTCAFAAQQIGDTTHHFARGFVRES